MFIQFDVRIKSFLYFFLNIKLTTLYWLCLVQFGEVIVPNHPTIPVVPMALQMVYLYPIGRAEGGHVKYKMLVPMNAANSAPLFPSHSPPLGHLNLSQFQGAEGGVSPTPGPSKPRPDEGIKQSPPPLDLTNKSPEPIEDIAVKFGLESQKFGLESQKFGLENHLNLLKMKEMEMMKAVPVNRYKIK